MMSPLLASLSHYEAALLLVTLTAGGKDRRNLFAMLPGDSKARLDERSEALLAVPSEKRVALMVHELRSRLAQQGRRGIEYVDHSWILQRLRGESPAIVALLLLGLPPHLTRSVLRRLPDAVRHSLPPKHQLHGVPQPIVQGLRLMFESQFDPMPEPRLTGARQLRDIIELERTELFVVVRDLGLTELGQAFASIEKMALVELLRRLPIKEAKELIVAVKSASRVDMPEPRHAQLFLSRVVVNFEDTETFLRRSGLYRLARALLGEDEGYVRALAQRLPRQAGTQLLGYLERVDTLTPTPPEVVRRLQDTILVRLVQLSRGKRIGPLWGEAQVNFNDPEACEAALAAPVAPLPSAKAAESESED